MSSLEPRSLAATKSMSAPRCLAARKKLRPMRPNPLMPTRMVIAKCSWGRGRQLPAIRADRAGGFQSAGSADEAGQRRPELGRVVQQAAVVDHVGQHELGVELARG